MSPTFRLGVRRCLVRSAAMPEKEALEERTPTKARKSAGPSLEGSASVRRRPHIAKAERATKPMAPM